MEVPVRIISAQPSDLNLVSLIGQVRYESRVVIGSDFAHTRQLTFSLNARDGQGAWRGYTLCELVWPLVGEGLLGRREYRNLVIEQRRATDRNMRRARVPRHQLPKSDQIVGERLQHGMPKNRTAQRVVENLESWLEDERHKLIDEAMRLKKEERCWPPTPFFLSPVDTAHIVLVVSRGIGIRERELLADYLALGRNPEYLDEDNEGREVTIVLEEPGLWPELPELLGAAPNFEIKEAAREAKPLYVGDALHLGHVSWPPDTLEGQLGRVANLARQAVRDGLGTSVLQVIVLHHGLAPYTRTKLALDGVPVSCSESHLLPMQPVVWDLMSILALVHGSGRMQAAARLKRYMPLFRPYHFSELIALFEDEPDEDDLQEIAGVWTDAPTLEKLRTLADLQRQLHLPKENVLECARAVAGRVCRQDAAEKLVEIWPSIYRWTSPFERLDDLLGEFWRQRALFACWSGYKPSSGVTVTDTTDMERGVVVKDLPTAILAPADAVPTSMDELSDAFLAPVTDLRAACSGARTYGA